jgi:hypothetical protein
MSEENVEIVRGDGRLTNTGQPIRERIDAGAEVFDHDEAFGEILRGRCHDETSSKGRTHEPG